MTVKDLHEYVIGRPNNECKDGTTHYNVGELKSTGYIGYDNSGGMHRAVSSDKGALSFDTTPMTHTYNRVVKKLASIKNVHEKQPLLYFDGAKCPMKAKEDDKAKREHESMRRELSRITAPPATRRTRIY